MRVKVMFRKQDAALIQFADESHVSTRAPVLVALACFLGVMGCTHLAKTSRFRLCLSDRLPGHPMLLSVD